MLVITAGPSGTGKSRLAEIAIEHYGFGCVVPRTTRPPRPDERPGVDYHFLTVDQFRQGILREEFFDWDYFLANYYGYTHELVTAASGQEPIIIPVVARMALRLRQRLPNVLLVFLDGPDALLDERLRGRLTSRDELVLRLAHRQEEREHSSLFDIVVPDAATMDEAATQDLLERILAAKPL